MRAAKVSVFFIDDLQVVRPGEEGSSDLIRDTAKRLHIPLIEHELEAQFRCGGSKAFVKSVREQLLPKAALLQALRDCVNRRDLVLEIGVANDDPLVAELVRFALEP